MIPNTHKQPRARLLIVTQTVDTQDPVLGFFVRWIEEFAKRAEEVTVICLKKGKYELPKNVRVFSLGKEPTGAALRAAPVGECASDEAVAPSAPAPRAYLGRFSQRITYTLRFLNLVWRERHHYDSVFVHMNPEYVVLAGKLWRLMGKNIALWYTHKSVNIKLRIAVLFSNVVFTASPESFRLKSKKVRVVGHGIDMEQFSRSENKAPLQNTQTCIPLNILTTGRISETKRIMEMLGALDILSERGQSFTFTLVGAPATDADIKYEKHVRDTIANSSYASNVNFLGAVAHKDIQNILMENNIFLNLSTTGSMDKAVLEALATGMPIVTTNVAFRDLLAPVPGLFITEATTEKIINALALAVTADISEITKTVRERYALPQLIETICNQLTTN